MEEIRPVGSTGKTQLSWMWRQGGGGDGDMVSGTKSWGGGAHGEVPIFLEHHASNGGILQIGPVCVHLRPPRPAPTSLDFVVSLSSERRRILLQLLKVWYQSVCWLRGVRLLRVPFSGWGASPLAFLCRASSTFPTWSSASQPFWTMPYPFFRTLSLIPVHGIAMTIHKECSGLHATDGFATQP
nr:uncharacterized protein LOC127341043 [Lolium perenne]